MLLTIARTASPCQALMLLPYAQELERSVDMQVPQVSAGYLPERKQSVIMMQVSVPPDPPSLDDAAHSPVGAMLIDQTSRD